MTYGGQPPQGTGAPTGQPPDGGGRRPLSTAAVVVAVLAVVVVLGVVAGLVVIAVGGIGPFGRPDATPSSSSAPPSQRDGSATPPQPPPPPGSPLPPVTAANLPTSGDLAWPESSWHVKATESTAHDGPVAPCQTWATDAPPTQTAIQGRSYELGDGQGRAYAYVLSYQTVADAATVAEALVEDGLSCAERLQGAQGPRMDVTGPLGSGVVTDLQWSDDTGPHVGAWGVAREGSRVVWLWMESAGEGGDWLGKAEGHPMASSLNHALRRLRVGA